MTQNEPWRAAGEENLAYFAQKQSWRAASEEKLAYFAPKHEILHGNRGVRSLNQVLTHFVSTPGPSKVLTVSTPSSEPLLENLF